MFIRVHYRSLMQLTMRSHNILEMNEEPGKVTAVPTVDTVVKLAGKGMCPIDTRTARSATSYMLK